MILSEDGRYFFDLAYYYPYTNELHSQIISKLFGEPFNSTGIYSYSLIKGDIIFTFINDTNCVKVTSLLNPKETILRIDPLELTIELTENQTEEIIAFSDVQFEAILKSRGIKYSTANSIILTNQLKEVIYDSVNEMKLEIKNIPLEKIFSEPKETNNVFGKFSKYISLYMKTKFDVKDFPENKYFKESDFLIKKEDSFDYYYTAGDKRSKIIKYLFNIVKKGKTHFITGPHGIGKTFTLLAFLAYSKPKEIRYIYLNLDILKKEKNKMMIFFYEARNLFDNEEEFINAFKYIQDNLKMSSLKSQRKNFFLNLKDELLSIVICLVEYIDLEKSKKNPNLMFAIIIDQFKYINDDEYNCRLLIKLKEIIDAKKCFSLIVCSSLNYNGIKNNLINSILNIQNKSKFFFELENEICDKLYMKKPNEFLKLLGYLPRYCQNQKLINKKYINLMKKIIKKKFFKFYSNIFINKHIDAEDLMIIRLKYIKAKRNCQLTNDEMIDFIRENPIKYFNLNLENISFDYLFPLIEIIIDEIILSKELQNSYHGLLNEAQKGWYFEHIFFDTIKKHNVFHNYYIENIILIKTIFKKEKIKNFDKNANTLFCFSISNVKRYDGVIYIAENESVILTQVSINKPKRKLDEYTEKNMGEDIKKMQKFFKSNGISPKKYYLVFILDYANYHGDDEKLQILKTYKYNYCFFNTKLDEIEYEFKDMKEIGYNPYEFSEEEDKVGYLFCRDKNFKIIKDELIEYKPGYYYAEKGMDLITFLEETCNEYKEIIEELSKDKKLYLNYKLKSIQKDYFGITKYDELYSFTRDRIVIALNDNDLLFGTSNYNEDSIIIDYNWQKWTYEIIGCMKKNLNDMEKNYVHYIEGFFIFENQKRKE